MERTIIRPVLIHLLLLASICCQDVHAQRIFFEEISVQEGLPASKVYAVLQDSSGYIWVGTQVGLTRTDGQNIVTFDDPENVAPNGSRSLFLDDQGRVWSGHLGGGITLVEGQQEKVIDLQENSLDADITSILQDDKKAIWLSTVGAGIVRIKSVDQNGQAIGVSRYGENEGAGDRVFDMIKLDDGRLICITGAGLRQWDGQEGRFKPLELEGLPTLSEATSIYQDVTGKLWFGTFNNGAFAYDMETKSVRHLNIANGLPSNIVMSFGEDAQGRIWIGTWDAGIACLDPENIRIYNSTNGLSDNAVRCIYRDREGNMLLGTNEHGLNIFKGEQFLCFTQEDGLVDQQVWAGIQDKRGRIWFGTQGGITILDPEGNGPTRVQDMTMQEGQLTSNKVRALVQDDRGIMWIGTQDGGLFEVDPNSYRFRYDNELSGTLPSNSVTCMIAGQPGAVWIGTLGGLIRYVPTSGAITNLAEVDGLAGDNISTLYRDSKGTIWVGSVLKGISRVDNGIARTIGLAKTITPTAFIEDAQGRIWVGSEAQGIFALKDDKQVEHFTVENGLLSNSIRSMNIDNENSIWVGTNRGLNQWSTETGTFTAFTERSGFTGIEAKPNATWRTKAGGIWFGTSNGATRVDPSRMIQVGTQPLVRLNGLDVNLEPVALDAGVSYAHDQSNIRINYTCVSLTDPDAVRYQYQLEGLDNDWQPLTESTSAHYPVLLPGNYNFRIHAMDRSGQWGAEDSFHFSISPPWWRTWWFYLGSALFLAIGITSYVKIRERNLQMRNKVLERKVDERTKEVAEQKGRVEELLLNILPKEISDELTEHGKAKARHHDEVSIMFTDMKGFTKVAEKMSPSELVNELHEHFTRFDGIIERLGLEKIKTIGDAYMAAGGVPKPDAHHALKVVLAALGIRELMREWQQQKEKAGEEPWTLRIGINTGPVVAGVVGRKKFAYDIWGDAVNTASRMESSGVPDKINVSGTTWELIEQYVEGEHRGKIQAKNKGEVDMYFVHRLKPEFASDPEGTTPSDALLEKVGALVSA